MEPAQENVNITGIDDITLQNASNADIASTDSIATATNVRDEASQKRGRGRPKGSKNKKTIAREAKLAEASGTETDNTAMAPPELKRRPGRPRLERPAVAVRVEISDQPLLTVPGLNTHQPLAPMFQPYPIPAARNPCPNQDTNTPAAMQGLTATIPLHEAPSRVSAPTYIIPPRDETRRVTVSSSIDDEDDGFFGLAGDGVGSDSDDFVPRGDGSSLEDEGSELPLGRRPPPEYVMDAFKVHRTYLDGLFAATGNKKNGVYERMQSFWLPHVDTFFLLQDTNRSIKDLYNPRFFYWDPLLLVDRIRCPQDGCMGHLVRHENCKRPRRVVDLEDSFWLIGIRYRCNTCTSGGRYQSWDPKIMKLLPEPLVTEFPAHLSHRSGISNRLFAIMRTCFLNGMGAKQFSDSISVLHRRFYDSMVIQRIQILRSRYSRHAFPPIPPFDDRGKDGYCPLVPSSQWLRDIYDAFIESHEAECIQHTALLSCRGCAIDHSFKITKQIGKVQGKKNFEGLLTVTNEFGQIVICDLVPTKAHSQFDIALSRKWESVKTYGLPDPRVFYTDNMSDKPLLERHFPSLLEELTPLTVHSNLPLLEIPSDVEISIHSTAADIDRIILSLLDHMSDNNDYIVGLDIEWNVDLAARRQGQIDERRVAVLQIAHQRRIYILQIASFIESGHLPSQLVTFLRNTSISKVGRNIATDLKLLATGINSAESFPSSIDIAHVAKEKKVIKDACTGLAKLSAHILNHRLEKDKEIQVSTEWSASNLTDLQKRYLALDVWASLQIFVELSKITAPSRINFEVSRTPELDVFVYSVDGSKPIARGHLSDNPPAIHEGIRITNLRALVNISEVYVPGAIIPSHNKCSLASFGEPPFLIVCRQSQVYSFIPSFVPQPISTLSPLPLLSDEDSLQPVHSEEWTPNEDLTIQSLNINFQDDPSETVDLSQIDTSHLAHDEFGDAECNRILEALGKPESWPTVTRSRVLKDIFHVFHMIYIPRAHGLRVAFSRVLRDAILLPDPDDKRQIISYLSQQTPPISWDEALQYKAKFVKRHCKFVIPPPEQLFDIVALVFKTYGPLRDAQSGLPLFNATAWKVAKNILELIKLGYVSDPPDVALYYCIGVASKTGLPIYRCFRGTNFTEGGVHRPIRHSLPIGGVSIRHTVMRLFDFILMHNLRTGTYNTTGQHYHGHYDLWLINKLQDLVNDDFTQTIMPGLQLLNGWVNGDCYQQTTEVYGVLPIPDNVQTSSGIIPYDARNRPKKHVYLASKQGTRYAVLTLHTDDEKKLFSRLMRSESAFSLRGGPGWHTAVQVWNSHANGETIFYKLVEHLQTYYSSWKTSLNAKHTLSATENVRKPVDKLVRHENRHRNVPNVPQIPTSNRPMPTTGLREPSSVTSAASGSRLLPIASFKANQKRPRQETQPSDDIDLPEPKRKRGPRKCMKCWKTATEGCKGNKNVSKCNNPCRDCGRMDCQGRDSRNRDKPCPNASQAQEDE